MFNSLQSLSSPALKLNLRCSNLMKLAFVTSIALTGLIAVPMVAGKSVNNMVGKQYTKRKTMNTQVRGSVIKIETTNAMQAQILSPFFYMTHQCGYKLWKVGQKSSRELEILAEDGNTAPLVETYTGLDFVCQVGSTEDPTPPGGSTIIEVDRNSKCGCITTASMLIGTNDSFAGFLDVPLKYFLSSNQPVISFAFDAGTEANTELCSDIPGPPCANDQNNNSDDGQEGFVHINRGISGVYDVPISYDWRAAVIFGQKSE